MNLSNPKRHWAAMYPIVTVCILIAIALSACKKQSNSTTAAASASVSSGGSVAGPCDIYSARLCELAGSESTTCSAVTTSTGLMPPEACAAGLKNMSYSAQKLSEARRPCDELVRKICENVGAKSEGCKLAANQTKQFDAIKCKLMSEHLPEVIAELKNLEEVNRPLSAELQRLIARGPAAPAFGPEIAKVQIVEFSDFQCPFCARAADVVRAIRQRYGDRVRFTFRHFPLAGHPNAHDAAEAALAAHAQGKFWEFHDQLFQHQQQLTLTGLQDLARDLGLNPAAFKKSLDEHKYATIVDADVKLGGRAQVQGTPTMFINGTRVADPTNFEAVAQLIETALKSATPG
jgi:protein-disulfide isomerase